jgi:ADP-heptose:LPS heptosyltransferase
VDWVWRRSALGDVVLLGAVAAAHGRLGVVTDPRWIPLVRRLEGVAEVVPWPARREQLPVGRHFDLQKSWETLGWPAERRIRKRSLQRRLRLLSRWVPARPSVPQLYAEALGLRPHPGPWLDLPPSDRRALLLAPGASQEVKRWSVEGFQAIGRRWDGPVVVVGSSAERVLVERVAAALPSARCVAEEGFERSLEALASARVALTNDSAWQHLAAAAGVPVVTVLGATHPDDGFVVHPGRVVQRALWCRPCTLHRRERCPRGRPYCLDHDVEVVWGALRACVG